MFEQQRHTCPGCGATIGEALRDDASFTCESCRSRYRVAIDPQTQRIALFEEAVEAVSEPLRMPKGSIRAAVTIAMAVSCWVLIARGVDVPTYLLSILLATVGYYFGFRLKAKAEASRIYDPEVAVLDPLLLPSGCIRSFLTIGFGVGAAVLYWRGQLGNLKYVEFFVVLAGLVLGHYFARGMRHLDSPALEGALNHMKGLIVLAAAGYLSILFLSGAHQTTPLGTLMLLSCAITFYFGARS